MAKSVPLARVGCEWEHEGSCARDFSGTHNKRDGRMRWKILMYRWSCKFHGRDLAMWIVYDAMLT